MSARALASLSDYEARYGLADEGARERVPALLEDASALMRSYFADRMGQPYEQAVSDRFDDNAVAVCCAVVARAVNVPAAMAGLTQVSQTTGPYSSSATFANPTGDLYLTSAELRRLGLAGTRVGTIAAMTRADREGTC